MHFPRGGEKLHLLNNLKAFNGEKISEMTLKILPYDKKELRTSFKFLTDTFNISFGPNKDQWPNNLGNYSFDAYSADIEKILNDERFFFFGVYDGPELVGQIELKKLTNDCGYVSLYYLKTEYRNKGLGKQLDDFAFKELERQGCMKIRLTVSELNKPGQRFYEKNGWKCVGPDPKRPLGLIMEKMISIES